MKEEVAEGAKNLSQFTINNPNKDELSGKEKNVSETNNESKRPADSKTNA